MMVVFPKVQLLRPKAHAQSPKCAFGNIVPIVMFDCRFESTANMQAHLPALGMTDLFDIGRADLSGLDPKGNVFVSDFLHKAFIGTMMLSNRLDLNVPNVE